MNEAPPPRQAANRWETPEDAEYHPTIDASRFAPLSNDDYQVQQNQVQSEPDAFSEEFPFAEPGEEYLDETAGNDEYDVVPGYGDDEMLPYPEDEFAAMQPPRSRRGPIAIAALVVIAIVGGLSVVVFRSGGTSEPPPVISADASPTKIAPEEAGSSEGEGQSKLIYDRVDPNSEVANSQLVETGTSPIADIPPIPEDTSNSGVSRVILEGGPGINSPADAGAPLAPDDNSSSGGTTIASSAPSAAPIGPKKVRTVVVRPDGTIVSSEAVAASGETDSAPTETQSPIASLPPASETPPAPAANENPLLADNFGIEVAGSAQSDGSSEAQTSVSVPDIRPPETSLALAVPEPPTRTPTVVATPGSTNGPIDLTPGAPVPSAPSAGSGSGFLVQVSSQRSQETALQTFGELQRRYPSILGDRTPNIQRADLGERGFYYRVRVGYPTRDQAARMCEDLKAAGGDCLLASR